MNFKFGNLKYLNDSDKMGDMSQLPLYTGKSNYLKLKRKGSIALSKTVPKNPWISWTQECCGLTGGYRQTNRVKLQTNWP